MVLQARSTQNKKSWVLLARLVKSQWKDPRYLYAYNIYIYIYIYIYTYYIVYVLMMFPLAFH